MQAVWEMKWLVWNLHLQEYKIIFCGQEQGLWLCKQVEWVKPWLLAETPHTQNYCRALHFMDYSRSMHVTHYILLLSKNVHEIQCTKNNRKVKLILYSTCIYLSGNGQNEPIIASVDAIKGWRRCPHHAIHFQSLQTHKLRNYKAFL